MRCRSRRGPRNTLDFFIGSRVRADIISRLLTAPGGRWWLREMYRDVGAGMGTIQREIEALRQVGLLRSSREGGAVFFYVREEHPLTRPLRELVRASRKLDQRHDGRRTERPPNIRPTRRFEPPAGPQAAQSRVSLSASETLFAPEANAPERTPSPMALSDEEVRHVALLARLDLSAEQVTRFREDLNSILGHIDDIQQLDLADVEPTAHPLDVVNVTRPDEPRPGLSHEVALMNAPEQQDGAFVIPRIVGPGEGA